MAKSIKPKRKNVKKAPDGWLLVPVKLSREGELVARAIALVRTQFDRDNAPEIQDSWTLGQVLEGALADGLLQMEREWLGTRSLDVCEAEPGDRLPESTPAMRVLLEWAAREARR